tara:strand:- start:247 stop:1188 length:942 start_codon:yes stop_codon:yes gene_type:complete
MADFDKQEYRFPDEVEKETKVEVVTDDSNVEIEIEDDTPEQDRNKSPLPDNVREELYEDELTDYSAKVKNKLLQMKKLANDERREKERAYREQQEAINIAQRLMEENKNLKRLANDNEKSILLSVSKTVELEMEQAKRNYREAYETGDTDKIIEAQQKMTEVSMKNDKVKNFRSTPLQVDETPVQMSPRVTAPPPDPTAVNWQSRNTWFGEDDEMTSLALGLHEKLKKEGVAVSSKEYYRRIDETIQRRFPEKFETDTEEKSERSTRPSTVVAPATRSTSSKKIRLTTSQQSIAKKLGLTNEQYAQAALKMES